MFERFTERARQVVTVAQEEARAFKHNYIGAEHLLLGLLRDGDAISGKALAAVGFTTEGVRAEIARIVGEGEEAHAGQIPFTPRARTVLENALREALSLGHNYIGTEHILLGLVRETEGLAVTVLLDAPGDAERIRDAVMYALCGATDGAERWAEYVICRRRGHVAENGTQDRKRCVHCGTIYWTETVQRELGAPLEPAEDAA